MIRLSSLFLVLSLVLAACAPSNRQTIGSDGKPLPQLYRISRSDTGKIQFRMLDAVNALRGANGQAAVELDPKLTAAAATHSRDMSNQNRPGISAPTVLPRSCVCSAPVTLGGCWARIFLKPLKMRSKR